MTFRISRKDWNSDELARSVVRGNAPYWCVALQFEPVGPHSFVVGTYGMTASLWQDVRDQTLGANRFRDVAFDASYQFIQGSHTASLRTIFIKEKQHWNDAVVTGGLVSNSTDTLKTFRIDGHNFFQRQWGGGLEYFKTTGSADDLRYNTGDALTGSCNASPNTKGLIAELDYLPLQDIKLAVRYTKYLEFNGARSDYTPGRSASNNNSLYLLGWILF